MQPVEIGTVVWMAPYRPGVHAYTPWYPGIENFPVGFAYTDYEAAIEQQFNPPESIFQPNNQHYYWKFVAKVEKVDESFKDNFGKVQKEYIELEALIFDQQREFEKEVINIYKTDPQKARKLLTDFSAKWALEAY